MSRVKGAVWAAITAAMVLALGPPRAEAVTWRPVVTGTGEAITAIDYRAPTELWFATDGGKVFVRQPDGSFALQASFSGYQLFDLAWRPSGDVALAGGDYGRLMRFASGAWTAVNLADVSYDHACPLKPQPPYQRSTPTGEVTAVAWSSDNVAWAITDSWGQMLKSVDAGITWTDVNRHADGSCSLYGRVTDVAGLPGSDDALFAEDDGGYARTVDGTTTRASFGSLLAGCEHQVATVRIAIDPATAARVSGVGPCALSTWAVGQGRGAIALDHNDGFAMRAVAAAPGLFLAVGDRGKLAETFDGKFALDIRARDILSQVDWQAVDLADRDHAAIGGKGGALALSDDVGPHARVVLRGSGSSVTAHRRHGHVRIRIRAKAWPPLGITPAQACQGTVRVTVRHGRRRLAVRTVPLSPVCVFATTVGLSLRRVGGATRLSVSALFNGNSQLGGSGKTVRVRVRP